MVDVNGVVSEEVELKAVLSNCGNVDEVEVREGVACVGLIFSFNLAEMVDSTFCSCWGLWWCFVADGTKGFLCCLAGDLSATVSGLEVVVVVVSVVVVVDVVDEEAVGDGGAVVGEAVVSGFEGIVVPGCSVVILPRPN